MLLALLLASFFEPNYGQSGGEVDFVSRSGCHAAFLSKASAAFHVGESVVRLRLVSARALSRPEGLEPTGGITSYFLGRDPRKWRTGIPHYAKVRYRNVYPGIDITYYFRDGKIEYDLNVSPGADPNRIELAFDGVDQIRTEPNGDLRLVTDSGDLIQRRPRVFQGGRELASAYRVTKRQHIQFTLARYDRSRSLVIDPVLEYSTYIGGNAFDYAKGIKVDAAGNAYIAGSSRAAVGPSIDPFQQTAGTTQEAFLIKLAPSGNRIVYYAYFGGASDDSADGVEIDAAGNAYVGGETQSTDFPVQRAYQERFGGGFKDGFITKLSPDGKTLVFSTYLGGTREEQVGALAVDSTGSVTTASYTYSSDFPVTPDAIQPKLAGDSDGYIARFSSQGDSLAFATYFGGASADYLHALRLDSSGNAYVAGCTGSNDFPVKDGYQVARLSFQGCSPFVAKLSVNSRQLVWSTFFGGRASGIIFGIDIDETGVYVSGIAGENLEVKNAVQAFPGDSQDMFVAKLRPDGKELLYCTYLGGGDIDHGARVAVGPGGFAYVTGFTASRDFPVKDSLQPYLGSQAGYRYDVVAAKLSPEGNRLVYSTFLGGNGDDRPTAITVTAAGDAYVAGVTMSIDFPLKNSFQSQYRGGGGDMFVAKITDASTPANEVLTTSSGVLSFTAVQGGASIPAQSVRIEAAARTEFRVETPSDNWLRVSPGSAATPATLTVAIDTAGLDPGTYRSIIRLLPHDNQAPANIDVSLRVLAPPPVVSSIAPSDAPVGSDETQMTVAGSGFLPGAVAQLNNTELTTVFVDSRTLRVTLPKSLFVAPSAHAIRVVNPQSAPSAPITLSVGPRAPQIANNSVVSAASFQPGAVSPGEIVTIFGTDLGPAILTPAQLDASGRFPSELAHTRVLVDGASAPLIYVSDKQISAAVPYNVEGKSVTQIQVEYEGRRSIVIPVPVRAVSPALFASVLNQDTSANAPSNPARRGSVIVLYGTGFGRFDPPGVDGIVSGPPLGKPVAPVAVRIGGVDAQILYAGAAPELISGVIQINAVVPEAIATGNAVPVSVSASEVTSQSTLTIAVN